MQEEQFMLRALELAQAGEGYTRPNPMVGAVIVRDGQIIAEGFHRRYGDLHAERDALRKTSEVSGATLYVNLEPCCHQGLQPPCTQAIIDAGIQRVCIATLDPNPQVGGRGMKALQAAGIKVELGLCAQQAQHLNRIFFHYITTGRPYLISKYAMTLDGKIATSSGLSKWISGPASREHLHYQRHRHAAILVGVNTVIKDDPLLTARGKDTYLQPLRIVCDSQLRTPLDSQLVKTARRSPLLIATQRGNNVSPYLEAGCMVWEYDCHNPGADNPAQIRTGQTTLSGAQIPWEPLLQDLAAYKIDSILIEGGAQIHGSLMDGAWVNEVQAYIAPSIFGGCAPGPIAGRGVCEPQSAYRLKNRRMQVLGQDILVEGELCLPE